jgi:hypothetical protein
MPASFTSPPGEHSAAFEAMYCEHGHQESLGGRTLPVVQHPGWSIWENGGRYELFWLEGRAFLSRYGGTLDHRQLKDYMGTLIDLLQQYPGSEWIVESVPPLAAGLWEHQVAISLAGKAGSEASRIRLILGGSTLTLATKVYLTLFPSVREKIQVSSTLEEALADWGSGVALPPPEVSDLDRAVGRLMALLPSEKLPVEITPEPVHPEYAPLFEAINLVGERLNQLLAEQEKTNQQLRRSLERSKMALKAFGLGQSKYW